MKTRRFLPVFFLTLLLLVQTVTPAWAEEEEPKRIPPPEIQSKAALLVDQKTGAVVYAKQERSEEHTSELQSPM